MIKNDEESKLADFNEMIDEIDEEMLKIAEQRKEIERKKMISDYFSNDEELYEALTSPTTTAAKNNCSIDD